MSENGLYFFLNGHTEDYLLLYNECGQYRGMITYTSLLRSTVLEDSIIHEKLYIDDTFWEKARALLGDGEAVDALPVFNQNMEIQYFAKYDKREYWYKSVCDASSEEAGLNFISEVESMGDGIINEEQALYRKRLTKMCSRIYDFLK